MGEFLSGQYDTPHLTAAEAVNLLSYPDAPLDEATRAATAERSLHNENTVHYARELQQACAEIGVEKVVELAGIMRDTAVAASRALGIEPSPYAHSVSWALWDIAKQRYTSKPEFLAEAGSGYAYREVTGDPFTSPRVRQTIVNRHVGWEIESHLLQPGQHRDLFPIVGTNQHRTIDHIRRTGRRNESARTLNSLDLARVGEQAVDGLRARHRDIPRRLEDALQLRSAERVGRTMLQARANPDIEALNAAEINSLKVSATTIKNIPKQLKRVRDWAPDAPVTPAEPQPIQPGDMYHIPIRDRGGQRRTHYTPPSTAESLAAAGIIRLPRSR